jgi:hypothetical protein
LHGIDTVGGIAARGENISIAMAPAVGSDDAGRSSCRPTVHEAKVAGPRIVADRVLRPAG